MKKLAFGVTVEDKKLDLGYVWEDGQYTNVEDFF